MSNSLLDILGYISFMSRGGGEDGKHTNGATACTA